MTARLKTLLENDCANTIKWRVWWQILLFLACVMISGHANAHYIDSDFSGEIEIYTNINLTNIIETLTDDQMDGSNSCDSFRIKSGILEIFYPGGQVPSCILREGDYHNLFNQLKYEDGFSQIIVNRCTWFKLRRDIMREEANKKYVTSLNKRIDELKNGLNTVVTKTTAIEATIAAKLEAMEISEDDKQTILAYVNGALQPTIDDLQQTLTDEITTSIFDKLKAEGVVED